DNIRMARARGIKHLEFKRRTQIPHRSVVRAGRKRYAPARRPREREVLRLPEFQLSARVAFVVRDIQRVSAANRRHTGIDATSGTRQNFLCPEEVASAERCIRERPTHLRLEPSAGPRAILN